MVLFIGVVLVLQIYFGGVWFQVLDVVFVIVVIGMVCEFGLVLGGLMVVVCVVSVIVVELGMMCVIEQIDVLVILLIDLMCWLVLFWLWVVILCVLVLVGVGDVIGIMGGWLVGVNVLGFNLIIYILNSWVYLESWDVLLGLIKGVFFGGIVVLLGCWFGMMVGNGVVGVGWVMISVVVVVLVGILVVNFILMGLFF